jgi:indole-3-glycerol phosphate synthase
MPITEKFLFDLIKAVIIKARNMDTEYALLIMDCLEEMETKEIIDIIPLLVDFVEEDRTEKVIKLLKRYLFIEQKTK